MLRAIVLAAGKGTRMKSARPKVLHELCGRPMLWYVLSALRAAGIQEITVVTSAELQPHLTQFNVRAVLQEPQLGTGHAVQIALREFPPHDGDMMVLCADMPLVDSVMIRSIVDAAGAANEKPCALALVTARVPLPSNFGRVIRKGEVISRVVEERDCTDEQRTVEEVNAGMYLFGEPLLRDAVGALTNDNAQNEYYLTDAVQILADRGERVIAVPAQDPQSVMGINDRSELARARRELNLRLCDRYMRDGVTIIDPATTYLEPELRFGADTIIYPNTTLGRLSEVGMRCEIGPNTRLSHCRLGNDVIIKESVVVDSELGDNVKVGPFAHVRSNTLLCNGVHVGNFVEVKASRLGAGVKAGHLSYLGDATIGEKANIGAGTITCNYDGVKKSETHIGKGAFIGSNSSLIAPVTIGEGALTGASSVVTKNVEAGQRVAGNPAKPLGKK
ncbi:MAG: bifunctional UDP-N-acetylglucosamine diphosphorylase/glucosamine-1-phosphate N-acetyltransferase GlmU [Candidatus Eremiobacteraeota bacterium]|nr:bifunctional UDP-N-acetylglucosamine diphosphorylase/glucosamine-1-phosphate N-acetyltransferase GlmU [Candidatus Eremiobacteraeota bacterium]